ncbi:MAG: hypothetical protein P8X82_04195 [Gemmatimonadales bacterium]|jgi:adenine-specific DNA-methyltransferase
MSREKIQELSLPIECFRPVLPSSRHIPGDEVQAGASGEPLLDKQLFLLDTKLPEVTIKTKYPNLWQYLEEGREGESAVSERYLCRTRSPWYTQEDRPAAPIICTYMGRQRKGSRPFRFILNHSNATATNVYLMLYPTELLSHLIDTKPDIIRRIWEHLNGIREDEFLKSGRVYGGGLHKLEPKELRDMSADGIAELVPEISPAVAQGDLFDAA